MVGAGEDRFGHVGRGIEHVFAVVDHDQHPPTGQGESEALADGHPRLWSDSQRAGDSVGHGCRIADGGKLDQPNAVGEPQRHLGGDLQRESSLPDASNAGQRDQSVGAHQLAQLFDLAVATDEAGRLRRKVARDEVDRLQRRELGAQTGGTNLEDLHRLGEVAKPAQPEIDQVDPSSSSAVGAATRICPPCPAAITRAVRFNVGSK